MLCAATQLWCLAKLPLLLGGYVVESDPHWQNFLLMLTITDYAFSLVSSKEIIGYLKTLIQEHHDAFCELYPDASVIPKQHYIVHLPEIMYHSSVSMVGMSSI